MVEAAPLAPRVVVDPGGYDGGNIGDAAMLAVALQRIRRRWPEARIACHTLEPAWLRSLDPTVVPLDPGGAHAWNLEGALAARCGVPPSRCAWLLAAGRRLRRMSPGLGRTLAHGARRMLRRDPSAVGAYLAEVGKADLVVKAGAGALTDAFAWHAYEALETLALGQAAGAVTAVLGQGIGPIADPALRRRAAEVLGRASLVALRDADQSGPLVAALGVAADRVEVTGDDALALLADRPPPSGPRLGVNLRRASYSGLDAATVAAVGEVLRAQAARGRALQALPIDRHPGVDDLAAIRACVAPVLADDGDDGPRTVDAFIDRLGGCRVVVTGSYHGAVLALGAGIPAVTISASPYYRHKLTGLAGQFGAACRVIDVAGPSFPERLTAAIEAAWADGDTVRADLRLTAAAQVAGGEAAFDRLAARVEARARDRLQR